MGAVSTDSQTERRQEVRYSSRHRTKAVLWGSLGLVLVVVLLVVLTRVGSGDHPGGDPDGRMLQTLERVRAAVPPGASHSAVQTLHAMWMGTCGSPGSSPGWSNELVTVTFADAAPNASIETHIDSVLRSHGWQRHDLVLGRGQGPVAHWRLHTSNGSVASAFAYSIPHAGWFITADWQPPGPIARGCP
jgi:hypothetical protein